VSKHSTGTREFEALSSGILQDTQDILIIGSGISGLTAGAILSRMNRKVTILEQHYVPGGATHIFRRKGHEWNTGLHYIGDVHEKSHPLRKLFDELTDGELDWSPCQVNYDRLIFPDKTYDFKAGADHFRDELLRHFPQERRGIEKYLSVLRDVKNVTRLYSASRVFPVMNPLVSLSRFPGYFYQSTEKILGDLFQDARLRAVIAGQYGNYGLPPKGSSFGVHALVALHYMGGSSFPVGGSGEIARAMGRAIRKRGGKVVTRARVEKITTDSHGVTGVILEGGEVLRAKTVISTAGLRVTKEKLLGGETSSSHPKTLTPGYISLAMGFDLSADDFSHDGANLWVHPSYDFNKNVTDYFTKTSSLPPFSYISFPFQKDPSWKKRVGPKVSVDLLGIVPSHWFGPWKESDFGNRTAEYEHFKTELARPHLETMNRLFPELQNKLEHLEISTPLTVKHFLGNMDGEIYGLASNPEKFRNRHTGPRTDIRGLYLSGQDTLFIGIYGAMMSGLLTAGSIHPLATFREVLGTGIFDV
jgi:all-trans-retinol 13,14-reductase